MNYRDVTIIPTLVVRGAEEAIVFYQRVFGAQLLGNVMRGTDGKSVMHAELQIGNSIVFLSDEFPDMQCFSPKHFNGSPVILQIRLADADRTYKGAINAGAQSRMPPADMFWGDRYAQVIDPWGHLWGLATAKEQLTAGQIEQRAEQFMASMKR